MADRPGKPEGPPATDLPSKSQGRDMSLGLLSLEEVAASLHYAGANAQRYVKRLIRRHDVEYIKRGSTWLMTPAQLHALVEAMTCSATGGEGRRDTSLVRSVWGRRPAGNRETLRAVAERVLQRSLEQDLLRRPQRSPSARKPRRKSKDAD